MLPAAPPPLPGAGGSQVLWTLREQSEVLPNFLSSQMNAGPLLPALWRKRSSEHIFPP